MNIVNKIYRRFLKKKMLFMASFYRVGYALTGQIKLHSGCFVSPKAQILIDDTEHEYAVEIGSGSNVKDFARLCPREGFIKIGQNCSINPFCILLGYGGITIGNNVRMAAHCSIVAFNHVVEDDSKGVRGQGITKAGIVIEDDVWIGTGVRILDGVRIAEGCVIGAGSVVTKDMPPYSICVGVPARVLRSRKDAA